MERAASEGWDGAIFACSSCKGINPAGMLVCLHCSCPFIFRLDAFPDYLIAPMAQTCVRDVVKKGCPNVIVPDPVRFEMLEMARALNLAARGQQEKVQYISPVLALLALPPVPILELLDQSLIDQRARPSSF